MTPEETIRRALEAEAATVDVRPDALATIRAATRRRRTRFAVKTWISAGLAVAAAAVAVFALVDQPHPVPPVPPATSVSPPPPASEPPGQLLAVYYVALPGAEGLLREFHRATPASGALADRVRAAVEMMLTRPPDDPDYGSGWPPGTSVRGVTVTGDVVTVDLGGAAAPTPVAAQQLVWTVTATSGRPAVRIGGDGPLLRRAAAVDTLAAVWLINPQQHQVVRGPLDVHIAAFAPTARLEIHDATTGELVHDERVTLSGGSPAQREAHVTVELAPGRYTLAAQAGGAVDDHTIRVE